jgi:3-deoxy-manno-octulosonate cytidylyltransferase (CMP-KDO synthetase)
MNLGLIPARLKSTRLPNKPLLEIDGLPMIVHVMKRAKLCSELDKVIVCTDSDEILSVVKKYGGEAIKTKFNHINGTERISEVAKKIKKNFQLIIDIQCDEVFLNPDNIGKLIKFHKKNKNFDIVIPHSQISKQNNRNIVKILSNEQNQIIYLSRDDIPFNFQGLKKVKLWRHMDIISFKPKMLIKFATLKRSRLEKIENIELLRGLENNFKLGTFLIKEEKNAFSINTNSEYLEAKKIMTKCKIRSLY